LLYARAWFSTCDDGGGQRLGDTRAAPRTLPSGIETEEEARVLPGLLGDAKNAHVAHACESYAGPFFSGDVLVDQIL
jgi:hypothetical protein